MFVDSSWKYKNVIVQKCNGSTSSLGSSIIQAKKESARAMTLYCSNSTNMRTGQYCHWRHNNYYAYIVHVTNLVRSTYPMKFSSC